MARLNGQLDQLLVRVERAADADPSADQERIEQLTRRLLAESKELQTMIENGLSAPLAIELLDSGGIERNPKTGKIRLTVDQRH